LCNVPFQIPTVLAAPLLPCLLQGTLGTTLSGRTSSSQHINMVLLRIAFSRLQKPSGLLSAHKSLSARVLLALVPPRPSFSGLRIAARAASTSNTTPTKSSAQNDANDTNSKYTTAFALFEALWEVRLAVPSNPNRLTWAPGRNHCLLCKCWLRSSLHHRGHHQRKT
jgi:hypothetical protein